MFSHGTITIEGHPMLSMYMSSLHKGVPSLVVPAMQESHDFCCGKSHVWQKVFH